MHASRRSRVNTLSQDHNRGPDQINASVNDHGETKKKKGKKERRKGTMAIGGEKVGG
jgi:hypothetical protein